MPLWAMLGALSAVAAMSQSFRTVATVFAGELQADFGASAGDLGLFAGAFHLSFAAAQLPIGVALDVYGPRRTVSGAFLVAILGGVLAAFAPNFFVLVLAQVLIGIGCAPAFLGTVVFIANRYPAGEFARLSGIVLSLSGIGMLATGTPLAWVVETWSWRAGFLALTACSVLVLVAVALLVSDGTPTRHPQQQETIAGSFAKIGAILAERHTLGILALGATAYASFITLRGLWAAPMLIERYGYTLVESGHVLFAASVAMLLGPPIFGLLRVEGRARRIWIIGCSTLCAMAFAVLAISSLPPIDIAIIVGVGFFTGSFVLQLGDVRAAYPEEMAGRALAVVNMAAFLGVALMQWATGLGASVAGDQGADPLRAVFLMIAAALACATLLFAFLPWPQRIRRSCRGRA